jgi:hypothetical protein
MPILLCNTEKGECVTPSIGDSLSDDVRPPYGRRIRIAFHFGGIHVAEALVLPASLRSGGESQEARRIAKQNFLAWFCAVVVGGSRVLNIETKLKTGAHRF